MQHKQVVRVMALAVQHLDSKTIQDHYSIHWDGKFKVVQEPAVVGAVDLLHKRHMIYQPLHLALAVDLVILAG